MLHAHKHISKECNHDRFVDQAVSITVTEVCSSSTTTDWPMMRHSSRQPKMWPRTIIFPRYRSTGKWASTRPRNVSSPSSFWLLPSLFTDSAPIYRMKHPATVKTAGFIYTCYRLLNVLRTTVWLLLFKNLDKKVAITAKNEFTEPELNPPSQTFFLAWQ